jgi:hypothetical protein
MALRATRALGGFCVAQSRMGAWDASVQVAPMAGVCDSHTMMLPNGLPLPLTRFRF